MAVFAVAAFADVEDTAVITAGPDQDRAEAHTYQILGTWAGVITFEVKGRGTDTWVSVMATNRADGSQATTTTANGLFQFVTDGLDSRARFSTDTSGAPQVWRQRRQI